MKGMLTRALMLALILGLAAACGDTAEEGGAGDNGDTVNNGGKADNNENFKAPCEVVSEDTGTLVDLSQFNDVIARTVLKVGDDCPRTYGEIMAKMRVTDADERSCKVDNPTGGINTMVVSERSQLLDRPEIMRAVVTRQCNDRKQHELFFSLFGVHPDRALPGSVEVMSLDAETGVYNYYTLEGGEWTFFGSSLDLIQPGAQGSKRCAGCHTGGGPLMKELDTPWVHWEGHLDIPGASDLVDKNEDLGRKSSGSTMERLTKDGNRVWNETRAKAAVALAEATGDTTEMLRPLFCTVEVNVDNGTDFKDRPMTRVAFDFLLDPTLKRGFGGITVKDEDYLAALEEVDQIMTDGRNILTDDEGNVLRDTVFKFVYPERAFADMDYVEELKNAGALDDNLIKDILAIDFTRPIYSEDRCGLLQFAPKLDGEAVTPENLRLGLMINLEEFGPEEGSVEELFMSYLDNAPEENADKEHEEMVNTFIDACKARDAGEFMRDALEMAIKLRENARDEHHSVFEFPETMPFAGIEPSATLMFDPVTCELTE